MIRRLSFALAVLSLLLCVATAALWVRSFTTVDEIATIDSSLVLGNGKIAAEWERVDWEGPARLWHYPADYAKASAGGLSSQAEMVYWRPAGRHGFYADVSKAPRFGLSTSGSCDDFGSVVYRRVMFPVWIVVALFGIPPGAWLVRSGVSRRRAIRLGLCLGCGYALRASTGRCPECGRPVAKAAEGRNA